MQKRSLQNIESVLSSSSFLQLFTFHFCIHCFFSLIFIYLFMAALGLCCCMRAFSSCGKWDLLSSYSARASHCGGFCCRAWALGHVGSVVAAPGLIAPWNVGSSRIRDQTRVPLHQQVDSYPLHHQGSPIHHFFKSTTSPQ